MIFQNYLVFNLNYIYWKKGINFLNKVKENLEKWFISCKLIFHVVLYFRTFQNRIKDKQGCVLNMILKKILLEPINNIRLGNNCFPNGLGAVGIYNYYFHFAS